MRGAHPDYRPQRSEPAIPVEPGGPSAGGAGQEGRRPVVFSFVANIIARLEQVIDQETAALRTRTVVDLKDFNNRKSHGLLELSRALRLFEGAEMDPEILARLTSLRAKLETNRNVLKMHLEAVREVSSIIAEAIRDAESDGTYSRSIRQAGRSL